LKQKLTVTVDAEVISMARRYAGSRGMPLSSLIEQLLREAAGEGRPSFASRWRGRLKPADRRDPRYEALARKHL